MTNLFQSISTTGTVGTNRTLAGTQALVADANQMARQIVDTYKNNLVVANEKEDKTEYNEMLAKFNESQTDATILDSIIEEFNGLPKAAYLNDIDKYTLENMLKSQQSKRSRCKGKAMTEDNYISMMSAAIAESLLRDVLGRPKGTVGRMAGEVMYTEERLNQLANNQEALKKEIKNIQSKRSIYLSKEGNTKDDDKYKEMEAAEEQLKSVRITANTKIVVDPLRDELKELLAEVNTDNMKVADCKELINNIISRVFSDAATEDQNEPVDTPAE